MAYKSQARRGQQRTGKAAAARASGADADPQLSQREKFIQTVRELGCDETGEKLDEALRTIGRARQKPAG